ncbi:MAG: triose-phosphate isomerase, partial [Limnochordales bacterium]
MRTPLIAANWKMHKTTAEAVQYGEQLLQQLKERRVTVVGEPLGPAEDGQAASLARGVQVVVCPPFTALAALGPVLRGTPVALGAQNMHWEAAGAFTGEIAPG